MTEYTGQCLGGPDEGNLVTSIGDRFLFEETSRRWLDGPHNPPSVQTIRGSYAWDAADGVFRWKWPSQDEDTDDTRREDEPGDWLLASFDGVCSRGGHEIRHGFRNDIATTIRADGDGGWECRECVDHDDTVDVDHGDVCQVGGCRRGECAQAATFWKMPVELWGEFS